VERSLSILSGFPLDENELKDAFQDCNPSLRGAFNVQDCSSLSLKYMSIAGALGAEQQLSSNTASGSHYLPTKM